MKRTLLWIGAAVLLLSSLGTPTLVRADGVGSTNCGNGGACKPLFMR